MAKRFATHNLDANHLAIANRLNELGCTCQSLAAVGLGCPDLLVGFAGVNILLEIKNPETKNGRTARAAKNGGLDEAQVKWKKRWRGQSAVVTTEDEAVETVTRVLRINNALEGFMDKVDARVQLVLSDMKDAHD